MYQLRPAARVDLPAIQGLMTAAIDQLQIGFLDHEQIEASHAIMGVDTALIDDGTYYVAEHRGQIVGSGGWSRRATLYGGDCAANRDSRLLDPESEPARVRAMYTHPGFARRGIGRLILERCEEAALAAGFTHLELMATLSGRPLYAAYGFEAIEAVEDRSTGIAIPLIRMGKAVERSRGQLIATSNASGARR